MLCLLRPSPRSSSYLPRHGGSSCYVQSRPLHPPSTAKLVSFSTSEIGTRCSVSVSPVATVKANALQRPTYSAEEDEEDDDNGEDFQVLTAVRSNYNDIVIVETPKSRMLLLDSTHNVHSIVNKGKRWTGSYWDEFASLPAVVPKGPIAIFGLAGGTAAHLMLDLWPSLQLEGWEIDEILIDKAREYLGLSDLEKHTQSGGILNVHIGDCFSPSASISGGFAGIIIDLFTNGKVLPELQEVAIWLELNERLMPNGRLMVNCGGADDIRGGSINSGSAPWSQNSTIKTLFRTFPGQVSWKRMSEKHGANYLALTGHLPDLKMWSASLPSQLSSSVTQWQPCGYTIPK